MSPSTSTPTPTIIAPNPPPAAPTAQASLSHLPPPLLNSLAKASGTPLTSLSTLTTSTQSPVYAAVLDYIAISAPTAPMHTDNVEYGGDEYSSGEEDENMETEMINPGLMGAYNRRKCRAPIPNFSMGLGVASIQWPPLDKYSAAKLAEQRGAKRVKREEKKSDIFWIHCAHYAVGEPRSTNDLPTPMKEVVMASDSAEKLRQFAKEVCEWQMERRGEPVGRANRFELQRYRTGRHSGGWESEGMKRARPMESVILPEGMMEEIVEDVKRFLAPETKKWYVKHGLPQRRSYLFYGPPGTGKTSSIRVLASHFRLCCCYLSMTDSRFSNQMLGDALSQLPSRALVVLEDVDALFEGRRNAQGGSLTFSGLLNALDGLISAESGVITVMTSNHIEKLDQALIRGGRVDRRFLFGRPTEGQIRDLFLSFYPDSKKEVVDKFLKGVLGRKEVEAKNISTLQEMFIKMRDKSAEECATEVDRFFDVHIPTVKEMEEERKKEEEQKREKKKKGKGKKRATPDEDGDMGAMDDDEDIDEEEFGGCEEF